MWNDVRGRFNQKPIADPNKSFQCDISHLIADAERKRSAMRRRGLDCNRNATGAFAEAKVSWHTFHTQDFIARASEACVVAMLKGILQPLHIKSREQKIPDRDQFPP